MGSASARPCVGTATCRAGVTRPVTAHRAVIFGAACRTCPLRARCTSAEGGRTLRLHPRDAVLRAVRAAWAAQPALREDYKKYRPNVERVISQVASRGGRRLKLRYRGTAKNNAWLKNRAAALNLRNLTGRGCPRQGPCGHPSPLPGSCRREERPRCRPKGLAYHRTDGHCRRSSRPNSPLFSGLLVGLADRGAE